MKSAALGAIALGFMLLVTSGAWSTIFPSTSSWTPEKGARWGIVKNRLNDLSFIVHRPAVSMHRGPDLGPIKAEYEQLQKEHEQLSAEFQSAAFRPSRVAAVLKWTGLSLAVAGIVGWYVVKDAT